jgi:DNA-binding transcriptional ArsR family regulator
MNEPTDETAVRYENGVFEALAAGRRRGVLRVLDRVERASVLDLATHVVAEEEDCSLLAVDRADAEALVAEFEHVHLPRLTAADLVTRSDDGTVTITDHPALADPKLARLIETRADDWDDVMASLTDKRRRLVLTTLSRAGEPVETVDLAMAVVSAARGGAETESAVEGTLQALHHVHLPKLADAGLVERDEGAGTVSYEGHPDLDEEWLVAGEDDTPRAILSAAQRSSDIWAIEGRDNVTERGRALCESADDELFMMFTVPGTVETACVRRIQDAVDRGVDVYLGTQNRELRDLVRENVPEVTIWEPQLDWLNLPPTREKVGRLILADREALLVGTIGDEGPDGVPVETAITGEGEDNPLVMLLREMLGARLNHLDAQSADFRSQIPL